MRFVKQPCSLKVRKSDVEKQHERPHRHGALLPDDIRCIICGPSNTGKTSSIFCLLTHKNGLRFENVYIYSKSLAQPKYQLLAEILKRVENLGYFTFSNNDDVIGYEEARPNSVIIFDDVACDKQDRIREYFSMGRHNGLDCFYICQTFTRIPKHLIRDNVNFLILFRQDDINLKHIYDENVSTDMTFAEFKDFCLHCWKKDYGFVVIDKTRKFGRYRNGFDEFLVWYK